MHIIPGAVWEKSGIVTYFENQPESDWNGQMYPDLKEQVLLLFLSFFPFSPSLLLLLTCMNSLTRTEKGHGQNDHPDDRRSAAPWP